VRGPWRDLPPTAEVARKELWVGSKAQLAFEKRVISKLPKPSVARSEAGVTAAHAVVSYAPYDRTDSTSDYLQPQITFQYSPFTFGMLLLCCQYGMTES